MILFSSDPHWGHKNVIGYSQRPFVTYDGQLDLILMHATMLANWNSTVGPEDTVYLVGDFSLWNNIAPIKEIRERLNGKIILIRGNHDQSTQKMLQAGFDEVYDRLELELDGKKLYLSHIPLIGDDDPRRKKYRPCFVQPPPVEYDYWLCGHVHERWKRKGNVINVGVDQWNFTPVNLAQLLESKDENL
jgi:calcineurin-like phosphoesterase family protein